MRQSVKLAACQNVKNFHYWFDEYILCFSSSLLLSLHLFSTFCSKYIFLRICAAVNNILSTLLLSPLPNSTSSISLSLPLLLIHTSHNYTQHSEATTDLVFLTIQSVPVTFYIITRNTQLALLLIWSSWLRHCATS